MITKKEDKRNDPNMGLFQNAKGVYESPLDVIVIYNEKEMSLLGLLNKLASTQKTIAEDIANLKNVLTKYAEAEKINDTAIASSLDTLSKRVIKLETLGNIWEVK